jgi:hypothetical protein
VVFMRSSWLSETCQGKRNRGDPSYIVSNNGLQGTPGRP